MNTDRNPPSKPYSEVDPRDLVLTPTGLVYEVTHTQSWQDAAGRDMVALLVMPLAGRREPEMWKEQATVRIDVAADEQVAAARARARRDAVVDGLLRLADLIRVHELPLPTYGAEIQLRADSRDDAEQWARALHADVRERVHGDRMYATVTVDLGDQDAAALGLSVSCPAVKVESEPAASRPAPPAWPAAAEPTAPAADIATLGGLVEPRPLTDRALIGHTSDGTR